MHQEETFAKDSTEPYEMATPKKSLYYNHPHWPSPRAVRFVRELAKYGYVNKPAGRLTHDIALGILADKLGMTVPVFLRDITPVGLLRHIYYDVSPAQLFWLWGSASPHHGYNYYKKHGYDYYYGPSR